MGSFAEWSTFKMQSALSVVCGGMLEIKLAEHRFWCFIKGSGNKFWNFLRNCLLQIIRSKSLRVLADYKYKTAPQNRRKILYNFGGKQLFSMVMFEVCPRIIDGLRKAAKWAV